MAALPARAAAPADPGTRTLSDRAASHGRRVRRPSRPAPLHGVPLVLAAGVLAAVLVGTMLVGVSVGAVAVPLSDVWGIVADQLGLGAVGGSFDPTYEQIVWEFRVPRVLLAALAGAGLSVAGVVLQAVVGNPLADPYVLGVSSGAALGAAVALTAGVGIAGTLGVSGLAFAGAVAAVVIVFALGQHRGRLAPLRLVLAGVAVSYVLTAATSFVQIQATPNELRSVMFWLMGSVAGARWPQLQVVSVVVLGATAGLTLFGRQLNALVAGDETAISLGVDVHRLRIVLLGLASLLTGAVIAVAGGVGFVGLMIPHLVRLAVGADHRRVLPLAALTGATYLVLVDLLSRSVDRPNELPLGIFTAAFGAPLFVWLLRRNRSMTP
jgi:iron complex transport system permease protein